MPVVRRISVAALLSFLLPFSILYAQWDWQNPVPQGNNLNAVKFLNSSFGWAVGDYGTILRTVDGGVQWEEQEYGRTDDMRDVFFVDPLHGWGQRDDRFQFKRG
jgi:hypothetical protein